MHIFLLLAYLIAFVLTIFVAIQIIREAGYLRFPLYFHLYIAFLHFLFPILFFWDFDYSVEILGRRFPVKPTDFNLSLNMALIISTQLAFSFGWRLGGNVPILGGRINTFHEFAAKDRAVDLLPWVFLVFGVIGFYIYFIAFGGIFSALSNARQFRTGAFEVDNPFTVMRPIGDFVKVAAVLFFALIIGRRWRISTAVGFMLSFSLSILMFLFQGGRLNIAVFMAIMLMYYWTSTNRVSSFRIGITLSFAAMFLFFGYDLLYTVYNYFGAGLDINPQSGRGYSPWVFIIYELSFPSLSLTTAFDSVYFGAVDMRYGIDVVIGLTSILPSRLWSIDITRIGLVHTAEVIPVGVGPIPVDIITYGIYSFGVWGPAIVGLFVGFFSRWLFRHVERIPWYNIRLPMKLLFLAQMVRSLAYFDPASSINRIYYLLIALTLIYVWALIRMSATREGTLVRRGAGVSGVR